MASRQANMSGSPTRRSPTGPRRVPVKKPDTPRKPPDRPRRKPTERPRRDKPPERPRRTSPKPTPRTPTRVPRVIPGPTPVPRKFPHGRAFGLGNPWRIVKSNPWASAVIGGAGLLAWWLYQQDWNPEDNGWQLCCKIGDFPNEAYRVTSSADPIGTPPARCSRGSPCGTVLQVPTGSWPGTIPAVTTGRFEQFLYLGPYNSNQTRMDFTEKWSRTKTNPGPALPEQNPEIEEYPVPFPIPEAPYVPWSPPEILPEWQPLPISPPLTRPQNDPTPRNRYDPLPRVRVGRQPAINIDTRDGPIPAIGEHEQKPPSDGEKEGKKRINGAVSAAFHARLLDRAINTFTEMDDFVAALYQGLHWTVRRWRGRDGVWRDRDYQTHTRSMRIYNEFGKFSIAKAISAVAANEAQDRAFGIVGRALARRAGELGKEGLWASSGGFQRGGSLHRQTWEQAYARLKREQAAKVPPSRKYTTSTYDEANNEWVSRKHVYNSRTTLPWYRQRSEIDRYPGRNFTGPLQPGAKDRRTVSGHYYAPKSTKPRPVTYRPRQGKPWGEYADTYPERYQRR